MQSGMSRNKHPRSPRFDPSAPTRPPPSLRINFAPMQIRPLSLSLLVLCALSSHAAVPPADEAARKLTRDIYQELIEINTTESSGNCTAAAQAMAARLKAAGFPED